MLVFLVSNSEKESQSRKQVDKTYMSSGIATVAGNYPNLLMLKISKRTYRS